MKSLARQLRNQAWALARRTRPGYRLWLVRRYHLPLQPTGQPVYNSGLAVLRSRNDIHLAVREVNRCGLPTLGMQEKYWDALHAISFILRHASRNDAVLDGGAELYSPVLPWLARYGYRRLRGNNLLFKKAQRMGAIRYEYGDITKTCYPDGEFAAVTCMSVVEHGVDLPAFFAEMRRVIRPGGLLLLSTDYWQDQVDVGERTFFNAPWRIFTRADIVELICDAERAGFMTLGSGDLTCDDRVIEYDGLAYTFVFLAFRSSS